MRFELITGLVMSGKTKYLIELMRLMKPENYITVVSDIVGKNENFRIRSRAEGFEEKIIPTLVIQKEDDLYNTIENKFFNNNNYCINTIFVDEVQFLETKHIDSLIKIANNYDIRIICSGISHTFKHDMWDTIKYILTKKNIKVKTFRVKCYYCDQNAERNKKIRGSINSGDIDTNSGNGEKYIPSCLECWIK